MLAEGMTAKGNGGQATFDNMPGESYKAGHTIEGTVPAPEAEVKGYERQVASSNKIPRKPHDGVAFTSKRIVADVVLDVDNLLVEGGGHIPNEGGYRQDSWNPRLL